MVAVDQSRLDCTLARSSLYVDLTQRHLFGDAVVDQLIQHEEEICQGFACFTERVIRDFIRAAVLDEVSGWFRHRKSHFCHPVILVCSILDFISH